MGELNGLWVHLGGLRWPALRSLRLVGRVIVELLNHVHFVAMELVLVLAVLAAAPTPAAPAKVARREAARTLPAALDAAAGAAEDEQEDKRGHSEQEHLPPDFILADERPLPERVLSACDLSTHAELCLDLFVFSGEEQDQIVVDRENQRSARDKLLATFDDSVGDV